MAWRIIDGLPVCVQIIRENDPRALDVTTNPEAATNIQELAKLAAYKAFCRMGVRAEDAARYREDAEQEAAVILCQYAHRCPVVAYTIAKRRLTRWIVCYVWQGKKQTPKDKREGRGTLPPPALRLTLFNGEAEYLPHHCQCASPEELLEVEVQEDREGCVEHMFDVIYDLVAYHMGVTRLPHEKALSDARVMQLRLQGANTQALARELALSEDAALKRLRTARKRLEAFAEKKGGYQTIANMYSQGTPGRCVAPDAQAREEFMLDYVGERQAKHETQYNRRPPQRTIREWQNHARDLWDREHRVHRSPELEEVA